MSENPSTPSEGRRRDAIIVVQQRNDEKALIIQRMNGIAEALLGYGEHESIVGRKLETILSTATAQMLDEDIEYENDAPDLGEILGRQREIRLRHKMGEEITAPSSITRLMSEDGHDTFQLVIPDDRDKRAKQKIRDFIALNLEGRQQLDPATGLPDRSTAQNFLPLLKNYLTESNIEASFAVLRMDRHDKNISRYGAQACVELLQHLSNCCKATFRSEDIVFALSDHTLGLVLFDISRESARVVLNRLRWNIRTHRIEFGGKSDFSISATVCFDMIDAEHGSEVLARCEESAANVDAQERNALVELGN